MARWLVERRLGQNASRLKSLRTELSQIDEQLEVFSDDADSHEIRALVSETPGAVHEATDARRHADAMARHRAHVVANIVDLEKRQDDLLDRLTAKR
jgi:hypothetical protein